MPSVSEQLQKYRTLNAAKAPKDMPATQCAVKWQHPNTQDFFRNLMKEWHQNSAHGRLLAIHE